MHISWKYLDKRNATIKAIEDYEVMKFILDHTEEKIRLEQERMTGLSSPLWDGMPHVKNEHAGEDRIVNGLEEIDLLKERYRQAVEYMEWFRPAWEELSDDERFVLDAFYHDENTYGDRAVELVMEKYYIKENSAHVKKKRALDHLRVLMYGRN